MIDCTFHPIHGEMWKQIAPGYFLSNMGRWYSVARGRLLKQRPNLHGYMRAYAVMDGRKDIFTHLEVVAHFGDRNSRMLGWCDMSLRERGLSIDHVDGNKLNNAQSNLEIVTHKENCRRSSRWPKKQEEEPLPW